MKGRFNLLNLNTLNLLAITMYVIFLSTDSKGEASQPDAFESMCKKTNNTLMYLDTCSSGFSFKLLVWNNISAVLLVITFFQKENATQIDTVVSNKTDLIIVLHCKGNYKNS